jgi:hypothetical protein
VAPTTPDDLEGRFGERFWRRWMRRRTEKKAAAVFQAVVVSRRVYGEKE